MKSARLVAVLALTACGGGPSDPCEGAMPGEACRWAGTGVQGFNREHPQVDRLDTLFNQPTDIKFAADGRAYVIDWNNHMVRRVNQDQTVDVVVGTPAEGDGAPDHQDTSPLCTPAGFDGTIVSLNHPTSAVFGPDGLLYIAAWHNNKIRTYDTATGEVHTIAGDFYGFLGDGGPACQARFNQPSSLAIADDGTMYVADQRNIRIRKIAADRTISTIAGDGKYGNIGDGGPASAAEFGWVPSDTPPVSGSVVLSGNTLYVADSGNNRIREIHLDTGLIDCIAGESAVAGYSGDDGPALAAQFDWPLGMALGPDGRLYVADRSNNAVRAIDLAAKTVTTIVGNGKLCDTSVSSCPDRAPARDMELNQPYGVSFDLEGNLYVADTNNSRIVKVVMP